ncbi:MAG: azurin [Eikenella sp.]|nr:azurin [Eikenella sp.]
MKIRLPALLASALILAACGGESAPSAPPAASVPAAASAPASAPADHSHHTASEASAAETPAPAAAGCSLNVETGDSMQYNTKEINVPKGCADFTVTLKHTGTMPKAAMGHNIVITKAADMNGVNSDGISAGVDQGYLKPDDERVIAATGMIGGGEETSVTFPVSKLSADGEYKFFCTFPGHAGVMNGQVKLVD